MEGSEGGGGEVCGEEGDVGLQRVSGHQKKTRERPHRSRREPLARKEDAQVVRLPLAVDPACPQRRESLLDAIWFKAVEVQRTVRGIVFVVGFYIATRASRS